MTYRILTTFFFDQNSREEWDTEFFSNLKDVELYITERSQQIRESEDDWDRVVFEVYKDLGWMDVGSDGLKQEKNLYMIDTKELINN